MNQIMFLMCIVDSSRCLRLLQFHHNITNVNVYQIGEFISQIWLMRKYEHVPIILKNPHHNFKEDRPTRGWIINVLTHVPFNIRKRSRQLTNSWICWHLHKNKTLEYIIGLIPQDRWSYDKEILQLVHAKTHRPFKYIKKNGNGHFGPWTRNE